jgi:Mrp family chromosome partitioning ATPase
VLAGKSSLDESLVDYPIDADTTGRLMVLPAGPPPRDPAALISSETMRRVLGEAESRSDLVIIDSPAALAVSDPLPLMPVVSGVVLVARMNRSSRVVVKRLQRVIEAAGGTSLGVVATGVTATLGYDHYSPRYYTQSSANGSDGRSRRGERPVSSSSGPEAS